MSLDETCCQHPETIYIPESCVNVCKSCGLEVKGNDSTLGLSYLANYEEMLDNRINPSTLKRGKSTMHQSRHVKIETQVNQFVRNFANSLASSQNGLLISRAKVIAIENWNLITKNKAGLCICALYLSQRELSIPTSLAEVSVKTSVPLESLVQCFRKLSRQVKTKYTSPSAYLQKLVEQVWKDKDLIPIANQLIDLSAYCWFNQGRDSKVVAGGCFSMALASKLKKRPSMLTFKKVAAAMFISHDSLKRFYKDLQVVLMELCSKIPWIKKDFDKEMMFVYVDDVLEYAASLDKKENEEKDSLATDKNKDDDDDQQRSASSSMLENPRSFTRSVSERQALMQKIKDAKKRIEGYQMGLLEVTLDNESNLDSVDLEIEKLLEKGQTEDQLLNKNWKSFSRVKGNVDESEYG